MTSRLACLQTTASESTFVALLAARTEAIRKCRVWDHNSDDAEINARLVGYCSEQVRHCVTAPNRCTSVSKF